MMNDGERAEKLLAALDPQQRAVATHRGGPLVVLAGAGTGKTRAMTHRIAHGSLTGSAEAGRTLALTFTAKAAGEMRSRLRSLGVGGVQARTFHSAALRQLRYFWPAFADGPFPELIVQKAGAVAAALAEAGYEVERETVRDVAAEIEYAAVSMLSLEEYAQRAAGRELPAGMTSQEMVRIMHGYSELKVRRRALDFEDVLVTLTGVLATRPDIAAKVHDQYRHFVVDEFQDVSALQYDLLGRWLGSRTDLCVVGDPAQTIYTFAGATDAYLLNLDQTLPGARTISLTRNYRSTPPIVAAANQVLRHTGAHAMTLQPVKSGGSAPRFTEYVDDHAEAFGVAAAIAAQIESGIPPAHIAVLFRTNGQSQAFEEALADHGLSYVVRGGERFFARREIKEAIALLRSTASQRLIGPLNETVREIFGVLGWSETAPNRAGAIRERWESLNALVNLADVIQADKELPVPISDFVAELDDRQEHQFAPEINGVTLASIHAAKGLEWPHVHLVGMNEGLMPISYAKGPAHIAEERRLFYVAVTRACDSLSVSWSKARQAQTTSQRKVSRFVSEMRGHASAHTGPEPRRRSNTPRMCANCGGLLVGSVERTLSRCKNCAPPAHAQVLSALQQWRRTTAQTHRVPIFLVLPTPTLTAIAEKCPRTTAELEQIPGMGPIKLAEYGGEILNIVAQNSPPASY